MGHWNRSSGSLVFLVALPLISILLGCVAIVGSDLTSFSEWIDPNQSMPADSYMVVSVQGSNESGLFALRLDGTDGDVEFVGQISSKGRRLPVTVRMSADDAETLSLVKEDSPNFFRLQSSGRKLDVGMSVFEQNVPEARASLFTGTVRAGESSLEVHGAHDPHPLVWFMIPVTAMAMCGASAFVDVFADVCPANGCVERRIAIDWKGRLPKPVCSHRCTNSCQWTITDDGS